MSISDPIGDMLTRLRNGMKAGKPVVEVPASNLTENILSVLQREGYVRGFKKHELRKGVSNISVELKYHEEAPAIRELKRVSKPGRRVYSKTNDLKPVYNGLGILILSTPQGVLSDVEARQNKVGGEIICSVF